MKTHTELYAEIEETQRQFHLLLQRIPDAAFDWPSSNPAWTIGEVLYHMSLAPRFMVADVKIILERPLLLKWLPKLFPERLFHWLNAHLTRYGARHLNRQSLADEYNKAHTTVLQTLNSLSESELQKKARYPNWDPLLAGDVSMAYLFGYVKRHFDSHAAEIEQILAARLTKEAAQ